MKKLITVIGLMMILSACATSPEMAKAEKDCSDSCAAKSQKVFDVDLTSCSCWEGHMIERESLSGSRNCR
jgi:PBP1b-binding outer membrane lipoprotein LpoB